MKSSYGKGGREGEKKRTCCFALSVPLLQIDLIGEKGGCETCIFIPGGDERSGTGVFTFLPYYNELPSSDYHSYIVTYIYTI